MSRLDLTSNVFKGPIKPNGMFNTRGQWRSALYDLSEDLRDLAARLAIESRRQVLLEQTKVQPDEINKHIVQLEAPEARRRLKAFSVDESSVLSTAESIAYTRQFEVNTGYALGDSSIRHLNEMWGLPLALESNGQIEFLSGLYKHDGNSVEPGTCYVRIKRHLRHFHTRALLATPGRYGSSAMYAMLEALAIMKRAKTATLIESLSDQSNLSGNEQVLLSDLVAAQAQGCSNLLAAHSAILSARFKKGSLSWQVGAIEKWAEIGDSLDHKKKPTLTDEGLLPKIAAWHESVEMLSSINTHFDDMISRPSKALRSESWHIGVLVASFVLGGVCTAVPWVFYPSIVGMAYSPVFSGMPLGVAYAIMLAGLAFLIAGIGLAAALAPCPKGQRIFRQFGPFSLNEPVFELPKSRLTGL